MLLKTLLNTVTIKGAFPANGEVSSVTCVSSDCGPDTLFFALKGEKRDGHDFLSDATQRGCRFAVVERETTSVNGLTQILVANGREAMALASTELYGNPSKELLMAGITGTSGKTTSSYLLDSVLRSERPSTIIGTIQHLVHGTERESANTTPESFTLQKILREAVDAGAKHAVMEVSSHSLTLERVHGIMP